MKRKSSLSLAVLLLSGCATNKAFVADAGAARIYHEDRFERLCVAVKGPPTCKQMQAALQEWKRADDVANVVQKLGAIPKEESAEIKAIMKKVKALP